MKYIRHILRNQKSQLSIAFSRKLTIWLLYCLFVWGGAAHSHQNRSVSSKVEGELDLSSALRVGQMGTLTFSFSITSNQITQGQLEFRLPRGIRSLSPTTFNDIYLGTQKQQNQVAISVDSPGAYSLQASLYFTALDGRDIAEHFYLYLKSGPKQAEISTYPIIGYQKNQKLQAEGDRHQMLIDGISVGGTVTYYNDNQRQIRPLIRAKVRLFQSDVLLGTTFSDLNGDYLFREVVLQPQVVNTLQLSIEMANDILVLASPDQEVYTFKSDLIQNVEAGHIKRNLILDVDNPNRGAGYIFETIQRAHDFLLVQVDTRRTKPINVIWPQSAKGSYYYVTQRFGRINNESIHIAAGADQWRRNVMYHEYGHALMSALYNYDFNAIPRGEYREFHQLAMVTDPEFAFSEGWAEFFEAAVDDRALNVTGFLDGRTPNIENNQWWSGRHDGSGSNLNGALVEGSVASILWDIFDTDSSIDLSPGTDDDQIENRFDLLWKILLQRRPQNIVQIAEAWRDEEYPNWEAIQDIYASHRTLSQTKKTPILTFTAPDQVDILAGPTYQIAWTTSTPESDGPKIDLYYYASNQTPENAKLISRQVDGTGLVWDTTNVPDGRYYLLAVTTDAEGESVQVSSGFVVIIDQTPLEPPKVVSSTHPQMGMGVANNSPIFQFSMPTNTSMTIDENIYSYLLDQQPYTVPDTEADLQILDDQLKLYGLEVGKWWLHIRAYDPLGYWSRTRHFYFTVLPSTDNSSPSIDVIDYLIELSLSESTENRLKKWTKEIRLQPYGFATNRDLSALNDITAALNALMGTTQIRLTTDAPNFKIYFYPSIMLRLIEPDYSTDNPSFLSIQWQQNQITDAKVLIDSFRTNQVQRDYLIRKQVAQGLGLMLDSETYPNSIFYQKWNGVTKLAPIDKQVITLLYHDQVEAGMTVQQLLQLNGNQQKKPNTDEFTDPIAESITISDEINKPEFEILAGDVNSDGIVNILDLVTTAASFGKTGVVLAEDINCDGSVNILDLVIVSTNLGQSAVLTSFIATQTELTSNQQRHITSAIDKLSSNLNRSSAEEMTLSILKSILPERLPTYTRLLANYPNPFNPETWIPFRLAKDSTVVVKIYDMTGKQIKLIELGQIPAGNYVEPNRAILWDGRADSGELVVSGTYFYQIEVEGYTETRKMVIIK